MFFPKYGREVPSHPPLRVLQRLQPPHHPRPHEGHLLRDVTQAQRPSLFLGHEGHGEGIGGELPSIREGGDEEEPEFPVAGQVGLVQPLLLGGKELQYGACGLAQLVDGVVAVVDALQRAAVALPRDVHP